MKLLFGLLVCSLTLSPALGAVLFQERFDQVPEGAWDESRWDLLAGRWAVQGGRLRSPGPGSHLIYCFAAPDTDEQTITATITLGRRHGTGWAHAGLLVAQDSANYWHLALVAAPNGTTYGELAEQFDQQWQAQSAGATQLPRDPAQFEGSGWQPGEYVFVLRLQRTRIEGEIRRADGEPAFRGGYLLPDAAPAVHSGRAALKAVDLEAAVSSLTVSSERPSARPPGELAPARAAVMQAALPGLPPELPGRLAAALAQAGLEVDLLSPQQIADPDRFSADRYRLLAVPQCHTFPVPARQGLLRFLRGGGNLIACGGPLFEELLWPTRAGWLGAEQVLAAVEPACSVISWEQQRLADWGRAASHPDYHTTWSLVSGGQGGPAQALCLQIPHLDGWDTLKSPPLARPLAPDQDLFIFWARASERLPLVLEWTEQDGARWMATVMLEPTWRRIALPLSSFTFWQDGSPQGRGGRGDAPRPERLHQLSVGLAHSHASYPSGGPYTLWIGDIGAAPSPLGPEPADRPTIEGLSPGYKMYRTQADRLRAARQLIIPELELPAPLELACPIPRARGMGSLGPRPGRWMPLLEAHQGGELRGAAASTYLCLAGPFRHATWTVIGLRDSTALLRHFDSLAPLVTAVARRVGVGLWLARAGTEQFSYFEDQPPPRLAAYTLNCTGREREVACELVVREQESGRTVCQASLPAKAAPGLGRACALESTAAPELHLPPGRYLAAVTLREGEAALDRIEQEFRVLPARQAAQAVLRQHHGDFWLAGKRWYPHGINYWPSYATALAPFEYWLHWLSPGQYDPEVVEHDLARLQKLGANLVSIQLNTREQVPALNDFLERARAHGILVNIFLAGAHPLQQDLELCTDLVRLGRFAGNPAIFAYDLAWEPALGDESSRRRLEPAWTAWVVDRYGSPEAAAADWGFAPARRPEGTLAGPTQQQILNDGEHRRLVTAFRRFVDDEVSAGYRRVIQALRQCDGTHLFGARTGYGGTGQEGVDPAMPFDLAAGAKHLDFTSPEGYGLGGAWENYEAGGFTTLYGRWAGEGRPVFWAEFGYTIYPGTTPQRLQDQGEHYRNTYRMLLQSGANGSAGWWFPGGLRVDENSDFGIMHPDGTPRPSALALREAAPAIRARRPQPAPTHWITINRDLHPRGYSQVWKRHQEEYVRAVRAGETVGLRTTGTGTTSADCPAVAVGDVPWNGHNPPQYLNAEFNWVERQGRHLTACVGNTGEAAWLCPASAAGRPGAVYLVAAAAGQELARSALAADVPRYRDATFTLELPEGTAEVTLRLVAAGRTPFGPSWRAP